MFDVWKSLCALGYQSPLFFAKPPPLPLNLQTVQAPLFYANSPFILVFQDPSLPPKIGFLSEPPY